MRRDRPSAQLEAWRRRFERERGGDFPLPAARSMWCSATLNPDWLNTIDFKEEIKSPVVWHWSDDQPEGSEPEELRACLDAAKEVKKADTVLRDNEEHYVSGLAKEVCATHRPGHTTLVVLNTVKRAQSFYRKLAKLKSLPAASQDPDLQGDLQDTDLLLVHSRFRNKDRAEREKQLRKGSENDRIIVSTQAIEAGVNLSSAVLYTELAPWASLIQRFGRCNRYGEIADGDTAQIFWVNVDLESKKSRDLCSSRFFQAFPHYGGSAQPTSAWADNRPAGGVCSQGERGAPRPRQRGQQPFSPCPWGQSRRPANARQGPTALGKERGPSPSPKENDLKAEAPPRWISFIYLSFPLGRLLS